MILDQRRAESKANVTTRFFASASIAILGTAPACLPVDEVDTLSVSNRTGKPVWISYQDGDELVELDEHPLQAGASVSFGLDSPTEDGCTPGPLTATDKSGNVIARREAMCPPERWIIRK